MTPAAVTVPPRAAESKPRLLTILSVLYRMHPMRALTVVGFLVLSGFFEGVGILSLLPLLGLAADSDAAAKEAPGLVTHILDIFGIAATLGVLVIILVSGVVLKALLFVLALRQAGYAASDTSAQLRLELLDALMRARWDYFSSQHLGSLTNAAGSEAIRASALYSQSAYLVSGTIQVIVYLLLALVVSWKITLGAVGFVVLVLYLFRSVAKRSRQAGRRETALVRSVINRMTEGLTAIKPLKAMAREDSIQPLIEAETRGLNQAQRQQTMSRAVTASVHEPLIAVFLGIGMYVALGRAGIPFEQLAFMAIVSHRIVTRVGNTQTFYVTIMGLESAFWSLRGTIDEARAAAEVTDGAEPPAFGGEIRFEEVSFAHGENLVLDELSLVIRSGTITAISGPSGVGKTTFVDLLIGLFRPTSGRILVDGVPLNDIDMRKWRAQIGYVPQEVLLLHDTIRQNVSFEDSQISTDEVKAALRAAGAWDFVSSLPDGVETPVGERGTLLSGGQRQRIAIARALVRKPRLLILDEATTALDPITERSICATLQGLRNEMTIVAVSHQAAIVEVADHVVRLEKPSPTSVPS